MILVDSSAWIEFLRATESPADAYLTESIGRGGTDLAITEPVIMEVLSGIRSEPEAKVVRDRLTAFRLLPVAGLPDYEIAAAVYRACRRSGETVRNQIDCLIAAVAIRTRTPVLHADADFDVIARHSGLLIEPVGG